MTAKVACQVRIMAGKGLGMGPGKAAMLKAIQATRSSLRVLNDYEKLLRVGSGSAEFRKNP